jgi:hypothetical protein
VRTTNYIKHVGGAKLPENQNQLGERPVKTITPSIYSMNNGKEMAYQKDTVWSDGSRASHRVVVSKNGIRKEFLNCHAKWQQSGKPYKVKRDKRRDAERMVAEVIQMLNE